jgi:alkanesulfonate monooxygenase SsuD/methylene tetrahydromethanopterin reductase-like flavin-dependent oxidoreductase (luciferase family)
LQSTSREREVKVGIGLPGNVPGTKGDTILEWARRADDGPFSSLGTIDRLVYDNYDPLVVLSAAAGATSRVRLLTCVLLAPLHNPGILAKQAASLDAISAGRLTLGVGVGRRPDDYEAAPAEYSQRGRQMNRTLAMMRNIWKGEVVSEGLGTMGPAVVQPGGPEVLIGAGTPQAVRRVGRYADGFIAAAANAGTVNELYGMALESWESEGRTGKPRLAGVASYALGPNAADKVGGYIRHYYSFLGEAAETMARNAISTPEAVKDTIRDMEGVGMDEVVFLPSVADLDQMERLADII